MVAVVMMAVIAMVLVLVVLLPRSPIDCGSNWTMRQAVRASRMRASRPSEILVYTSKYRRYP